MEKKNGGRKKGQNERLSRNFSKCCKQKIGVLTCVNYAADPFVDLIKAFAYVITWIMRSQGKMFFKCEVYKKPFAIIFFFLPSKRDTLIKIEISREP